MTCMAQRRSLPSRPGRRSSNASVIASGMSRRSGRAICCCYPFPPAALRQIDAEVVLAGAGYGNDTDFRDGINGDIVVAGTWYGDQAQVGQPVEQGGVKTARQRRDDLVAFRREHRVGIGGLPETDRSEPVVKCAVEQTIAILIEEQQRGLGHVLVPFSIARRRSGHHLKAATRRFPA